MGLLGLPIFLMLLKLIFEATILKPSPPKGGTSLEEIKITGS